MEHITPSKKRLRDIKVRCSNQTHSYGKVTGCNEKPVAWYAASTGRVTSLCDKHRVDYSDNPNIKTLDSFNELLVCLVMES